MLELSFVISVNFFFLSESKDLVTLNLFKKKKTLKTTNDLLEHKRIHIVSNNSLATMQPFVTYTLCIFYFFSSEHTSLHVNESFIAGGTAPGAYYHFIAGSLVHLRGTG